MNTAADFLKAAGQPQDDFNARLLAEYLCLGTWAWRADAVLERYGRPLQTPEAVEGFIRFLARREEELGVKHRAAALVERLEHVDRNEDGRNEQY